MYGTGFFPAEKNEYYEIGEDGLYLTGTSEVALAGLHMGEILDAEQLPLRYTGVLDELPARGGRGGSRHARDVPRPPVQQGRAVRVHAARRIVERVRAHPRAGGGQREGARAAVSPREHRRRELSAAAAKRYDIEAWFPSQERYRELTSASNTTDFQARRLGIRYRREGSIEQVHTLNGTAVTDRWALAILENFQGEVPDVLRQYGAPTRSAPTDLVTQCYLAGRGGYDPLSAGCRRRSNGAVLKTVGPSRGP